MVPAPNKLPLVFWWPGSRNLTRCLGVTCRNLTPNPSGNGGKRNLHQTLAVMVEKVERPVGSQQDEKLEKCSLSSKNKSFFDRLRKSNAHIIYGKSQHFIRSKSTRKTKKKSRRSNVLCPSLQFLCNFYPLFWGQNRSVFFFSR